MASEDLQQMITETPYTFTGRKVRRLFHLVVLVVIIIFLALLLGIIYLAKTKCGGKGQGGVTLTSNQLQTVAYVLSNINSSIDPCDDFYTYACGGWMDRHVLAPSQYRTSVVGDLIEKYEQNWRQILDSAVSDNSEDSSERKLKDLYSMCLEEYGRMKQGGRGLINVLINDLQGWYVLNSTNWQATWNLQNALTVAQGQLRVTNAYFRFEVTRNQDVDNLATPMLRVRF